MVVPRCLMRCIWWERNSQCFEDSERTTTDLKLFFLLNIIGLEVYHMKSFYFFGLLSDICL